ncbi:MAG: hypothetical protein ACTHNS_08005 [Marmoricola sp.]
MGTVGTPTGLLAWRGREQHRVGVRLEPVVRMLAVRGDAGGAVAAAEEAGAALARDGVDVGETLEGLRRQARTAVVGEPPFEVVRALAVGWAAEALGHATSRSCADPLTGLASPAHLRGRLEEVYREGDLLAEPASVTHALVVVDVPRTTTGPAGSLPRSVEEALGELEVAERVRRVFPGEETLCRTHPGRLLVLARRTTDLGRDVARVRTLLDTLERGPSRAGVEDLPGTVEGAAALVAALARE